MAANNDNIAIPNLNPVLTVSRTWIIPNKKCKVTEEEIETIRNSGVVWVEDTLTRAIKDLLDKKKHVQVIKSI